jgi:outer membrane protein OmpA-like peptidoglycan-associated protein/uncharacterized protein YegL
MRTWQLVAGVLALLLGGCALFHKKPTEQTYQPTRPVPRFASEPQVSADCTPPPGYKPIWFRGVKPLDSLGTANPFLHISHIDPRPDSLAVHVQLMDSAGWYYSGGTSRRWDDAWCLVVDSIGGVRTDTAWRISLRELNERNLEPMALYIVMDYSGSMGHERCDKVQEAVRQLVKQKRERDAFGIIRFDDRVVHEIAPTTDATRLLQKLNVRGMGGYAGGTAIHDAVFEGLRQLRKVRDFRRKAIILFSDGADNASRYFQDTVIVESRVSRIPVHAVDFGDSVAPGALERLARHTGGSHHHIYGTFEFAEVFQDIYQRMLHSYRLSFAVRDVGHHRVRLRFCGPTGQAEGVGWCDNTPRTDHEWATYAAAQRRQTDERPRPRPPGTLPTYTVYFDFNIAQPREDSSPIIEEAQRFMAQYPDVRAVIRGHTDFTGSDEFNQDLSSARCEAVRQALIKAGVGFERIEVQAWGETQPAATNHTKPGRARNRRVEIVILPPIGTL